MFLRSVDWVNNRIKIIDQRKLPHKLEYVYLHTVDEVVDAIKSMMVRGAPTIGVVAALGLALEAKIHEDVEGQDLINILKKAYGKLINSRPTAVNLRNMLDDVYNFAINNPEADAIVSHAIKLMNREVERNKKIAEYGSELIEDGDVILTHCNTGSLAAVEVGTALGIIIYAFIKGLDVKVYVTETRPVMQGSRLTAYELLYAGIKPTLIVDSAVGLLFKKGVIDKVFVGADRILLDGTTYNKIGTYAISNLAKHHGVDFYVAAPSSTFDLVSSSSDVIIEERDRQEVLRCGSCMIAPEDVNVYNPAFDETPPENITGFITEFGVIRPPYVYNIRNALKV